MTSPHYAISVESEGSAAGLDAAPFAQLVASVLATEGAEEGAGLTLLFAGDELLRELNSEHRGVDEPTDVLSFEAGGADPEAPEDVFPAGEGGDSGRYLGDIAISVETARRQAEEAGLGLEEELAHLVLHGLLHLLGYDHETPQDDAAMRAREEAILGPRIHAGSGHEGHA